ncbi:MAG: DoxX family protein [Draconibacterium sp.]
MSKIFSTRFNPTSVNFSLLILRVATGSFMLTHGYPKLQKLLAGDFQFADPFGLGSGVSLGMAVFAEFFCSILLILGLGTRLATIPLIVTMAVAAFIAHGNDPFARKEMALLYLVSFIVLLFSGAGKISVDQLLGKR